MSGFLLIALYALEAAAATAGVYLRINVVESVAASNRVRFINRAMAMPFDEYERLSKGDLVSRVTTDINQSSRIFTATYLIFDAVARAAAAIAFLVYTSWMLSIVVFAVLGLSLWLNARLNRPLAAAGKAYQESLGKISAYALNAIEGLMVVKAFRAEEHMSRWFSERSHGARDNAMAMARRVSLVILAAIGGAFGMVMVFFGFGAYLVVAGKITVGSMLASMFLVDYVIPLGFLGERWADLHKCIGAYERVKVSNAALARDLHAVYRALTFLVSVVVFRALFAALGHYMTAQVTEETALNLRGKVFRSIMGGKSVYFDTHESGDLISRLGNDVETAKVGVNAFVNGAKQVFLIIAALTGLLVWSWPFAVGLLVMASVSFLGGAAVSGPLRKTSQHYQQTLAGISESATNLFGGVAVMKSLKAEDQMASRFRLIVDEHQGAARRRGFYQALQTGAVMSVPFLGLGSMMVLAGSMALRGLFSVGDAIGLVQLSSRALFPFSSLGGIWAGLQQNLAALDRVLEACVIPQERQGAKAPTTLESWLRMTMRWLPMGSAQIVKTCQ